MQETDFINVEIPASLWSTLDICLQREGITLDAAAMRLIDGISGLTKVDLEELEEPRKERITRNLTLKVGHQRRILIDRLSRMCSCSPSSLLRRLLYAFFFSKEIAFLPIQLRRTQLRFDFREQQERDSVVSLPNEKVDIA